LLRLLCLAIVVLLLAGCDRPDGTPEELFARAEAAKQFDAALELYRTAARRGHAEAQFHLGRYYERGHFTPQEGVAEGPAKDRTIPGADVWYRFWANKWYCDAADTWGRAAHQGEAEAMTYLGVMHYQGTCMDADTSAARDRWQQAAAQGDAAALAHFRRAADGGHLPAYRGLYVMHRRGQGVPQSLVQSAAVLQKGADEGSKWANEELAMLVRDLQRGAANGHPESRRLLRELAAHGIDTTRVDTASTDATAPR
jgi:TPR repeat protein